MPCRRWILVAVVVSGAAALAAAVHSGGVNQESTGPALSSTGVEKPVGGVKEPAVAVRKPVAPAPPAAVYKSVLIEDVPHVRQKPDFCGEACAAMCLQKLGRPVDQDYVFDQSGLDPLRGRGCHTKELAAALNNIGFRIGSVWHQVAVSKRAEQIQAQWKALHADLLAGVPSIICTRYDSNPNTTEHFRLVLGYDADTDEVIYHEPAETDGAYRRMQRATLLGLWPLKYDAKQWTVIRLRLQPGQLEPGKTAATFTAADYAQHIIQLKKKVPAKGFTIVIQPPFVVIGDESPARVKYRAEKTVKWAVDRLKRAYFPKDPAEILDIWLFKDETSYRKHTKQVFNHTPSTPYGYFSHADKALVMDIHTGGGTLVHEIVHPFVAANFPECPAWLNEGLGSLYEQSGTDQDGQIIGLTNWRLTGGWPPNARGGLQKAIRQKQVPSFGTLCSTTDDEFYRQDRGTNYAHARYLCYYLQEHGLLRKFYHRFRANCDKDPTGYETLKAVLGRDDMAKFQQDWDAWVLKLRFEP